MDFVCFLTKYLAKTIDFDIYAPSKPGVMIDIHVCLKIDGSHPQLKNSPAGKVNV
jgi:hypothetical protein